MMDAAGDELNQIPFERDNAEIKLEGLQGLASELIQKILLNLDHATLLHLRLVNKRMQDEVKTRIDSRMIFFQSSRPAILYDITSPEQLRQVQRAIQIHTSTIQWVIIQIRELCNKDASIRNFYKSLDGTLGENCCIALDVVIHDYDELCSLLNVFRTTNVTELRLEMQEDYAWLQPSLSFFAFSLTCLKISGLKYQDEWNHVIPPPPVKFPRITNLETLQIFHDIKKDSLNPIPAIQFVCDEDNSHPDNILPNIKRLTIKKRNNINVQTTSGFEASLDLHKYWWLNRTHVWKSVVSLDIDQYPEFPNVASTIISKAEYLEAVKFVFPNLKEFSGRPYPYSEDST